MFPQGGRGMEQLEEAAIKDVDREFVKLMDYINDFSEQDDDSILVVRYSRFGRPLYPSKSHKPTPSDVTACSYCGKKRKFEFQILPHLLNFLDIDRVDDLSFDFGTILVYTCF